MVFNWYLFTIGINWYLNLYLFYIPHCVLSIMYFQLVYFIDIMMHSIDIFFFFQLVSRKFLFLISPLIFLFKTKRGEYCFLLPVCWWLTKRGRKILSFICIFVFLHILSFMFMRKWFLEFKQKEGFWNICLIHAWWCIFMFNIHCIYLMFIAMHELRGSFLEA